jgi:hypothetical protein
MTRRAGFALLLIVATSTVAACLSSATKGTMPPPGPGGIVDPSSAPDYIAVAGDGPGIAGYARREDVLGASDKAFPVFGDDLRTVVGQMVPGKGFVPVGVDPNSVPKIPVVVGPATQQPPDTSKVVLYVRNDSSGEINTAVLVDGRPIAGGGFWAQYTGVECETMPTGAQLVLLDRTSAEAGARVTRVLYTRGTESQAPQLWIVVASSGAVAQGVGVPAWWGTAQGC